MPTFPTATTLTAAQLTGATVVPLSKASARNEITVSDLFGAGTINRLAIYTSDGRLTNSSFVVSVITRTDTENTFSETQTLNGQLVINQTVDTYVQWPDLTYLLWPS